MLDVPVDSLLDTASLDRRIGALRHGYATYQADILARQTAYLRAYSPPFKATLGAGKFGEHDQWPEEPLPEDALHTRSSFNETRPVIDIWTSLEANLDFPKLRWAEDLLLPPPPHLDDEEATAHAEMVYVADKLVSRHRSAMREQLLAQYLRRAKMGRHYFRTIQRKNIFGQSWLRVLPVVKYDRNGDVKTGGSGSFLSRSKFDNATVYPVWSDAEDDDAGPEAILVVTRRSAARLAAQWPGAVQLEPDGLTSQGSTYYYMPTTGLPTEQERRFVYVEDYWVSDPLFSIDVQDGPPIDGRVINAIRVNGHIVQVTEYPGWKSVPYFHVDIDNARDHTGFSDAATMLPFNDAKNRFLSEQTDVIHGTARPKFLHKSDSGVTTPQVGDEGITQIGLDEEFGQLKTSVDVFPTQVHGQQLNDTQSRATGLPPVVYGEIPRMNSGRALASAWKAVAGRMVPRIASDTEFVDHIVGFMLDCMELYQWDDADQLYDGSRDFSVDFPNQDSRDPSEITLDAVNRLHANLTDTAGAMKAIGDLSPDETLEKVRRDLSDPILHADERQKQLMIARLQQSMQIEGQQAQMQAQQAAQAGAGPSQAVNNQMGQAQAQQAQAQAQQAPTLGPSQNGPSAQSGVPNGAAADVSTMLQNGAVGNRMIVKG